MIFKDPWVLIFFPAVTLLLYFLKRSEKSSNLTFSSAKLIGDFKPTMRLILAGKLFYLRILVILLFFLALARPRSPLEETKVEKEAVDIVLAIDCSGSMLAEDFTLGRIRQNRLEAVKGVVENFISQRKNDRIGMIAFAARAYTVCPMTFDHDWLIKNLERIRIGSIEDGTAVGSAISSSLNRLRNSKAKSKIVILLTDGINNTGRISPLTAAEAGKALGIKIYTIGAGTKGLAPFPVRTPWGETYYENVKIDIDEKTLKEIATVSGGKYFRATDRESLENIYGEIDKLERTPIEEKGFRTYKELFPLFLVPGMLLLLSEVILANTVLRKLP